MKFVVSRSLFLACVLAAAVPASAQWPTPPTAPTAPTAPSPSTAWPLSVPVYVPLVPPAVPAIAFPVAPRPVVGPPAIIAADGQFLGVLSGNRYDPLSVANPYGEYGSRFSPTSITNPYGIYGSRFSPLSPNNPYAPAPVVR